MNAKEYLMNTDEKIYEAVINGYDIRLEEAELLAKMELYAEYKLNNLIKPDVMLPKGTVCLGCFGRGSIVIFRHNMPCKSCDGTGWQTAT